MEATPTLVINYFSGFKQNLVPLFQRPYTWGPLIEALVDVTPDPNRFLVGRFSENTTSTSFVTVTNWFDDLVRRAPVKK